MKTQTNKIQILLHRISKLETEKIFSLIAVGIGIFTILISITILIGYLFGNYSILVLNQNYIPMADETAFTFVLLGLAIILLVSSKGEKKYLKFVKILAIVIFIISLTPFIDYITNEKYDLGHFLIAHEGSVNGIPIGDMSLITALNFFFLSISLFSNLRKESKINGVVYLLNMVFSYIVITGYVYGVPFFYNSGIIPVSFSTALIIFLVSLALLLVNGTGSYPFKYFIGNSTRARLLRILIPTVLLLNWISNLMMLLNEEVINSHLALRTALTDIISLIIGSIVIIYVSRWIGKSIDENQNMLIRAEEELRTTANELRDKNADLTASRSAAMNLMEDALEARNQIEKEKERAEENEKELNRAQAITHIGNWSVNLVDGTFYHSDETKRIFGYEPSEYTLSVEEAMEAYHPDDRAELMKYFNRAVETGEGYEFELRIIQPNGSIRNVYSQGLTEKDKDGKVIRVYGVFQDITERKLAEIELIEAKEKAEDSEERIKNIFETLSEGIALNEMIFNENGEMIDYRILSVNKAFYEIADYDASQPIIGNTATVLYSMSQEFIKEFWKNHKENRETAHVEMKSPKNNKWFYISTSPFNNGHFLTTFIDITENKNYEAELRSAKEKAEESDKLKTAFLQNMSHEIRTPLNGILGFTSLLTDENITKDEIREYSKIIQNSGNRLLETIGNVLDISKIETGQIEANIKPFSINQLMNNLSSFFTPIAKNKRIKLVNQNESDHKNLNIESDDTKLNQILTNLISNAIKFSSDGEIYFGYDIKDNNLEFFVKDCGIGIQEDLKHRIFERFTQVNLSITRGYEGAGLGLAICKGLVELLGGKIWFESDVNKGTTFFFTIPLVESKAKSKPEGNSNKSIESQKKLNILIAEDDFISFQYLKSILKDEMFNIIHAENGEVAINCVNNNNNIDLIFMDIRMPVMDGMEATLEIKKIAPKIPIIAQTAYAFSSERDLFLSIGCDDYLAKPITRDLLMQLIEKYV